MNSRTSRRIFIDDETDREFKHRGYVVALVPFAGRGAPIADRLSERGNVSRFHASIYTDDLSYRQAVNRDVKKVYESRLGDFLHQYRVCMGNFMVKEPSDPTSEMPLHQDWSFVDEPELVAVHVWCALVEMTSDNGCLAVVPGSHHLTDPMRAFADDCPFRETFPLLRDRYLVEIPMQPGQAVFYDGSLVHGSRDNQSKTRRVAAQCICVPQEAKLSHFWRVSPTQVEKYEVQDEFFLRYKLHHPPTGVPSVGRFDYQVKQLSPQEIETLDQFMENYDLSVR
ncbi:MAG: phytanoyl-CoA dioxygenase family protein [Planctomycetota bacterium]